MGKIKNSKKNQIPGIIFITILSLIGLFVTIWSTTQITNTRGHASTIGDCSTNSTWSNIIGHKDYPKGVKYHFKFYNNCGGGIHQYYNFSATRPSSNWSYEYDIFGWNCSINKPCWVGVGPKKSIDVYVTIKRPTNAKAGKHYITLKANGTYNSKISSKHTVSYVVIPL